MKPIRIISMWLPAAELAAAPLFAPTTAAILERFGFTLPEENPSGANP